VSEALELGVLRGEIGALGALLVDAQVPAMWLRALEVAELVGRVEGQE
jgi:hypothetical protein